jgi:hypothetical protein
MAEVYFMFHLLKGDYDSCFVATAVTGATAGATISVGFCYWSWKVTVGYCFCDCSYFLGEVGLLETVEYLVENLFGVKVFFLDNDALIY